MPQDNDQMLFEQLLAEHNQEYMDAQPFDDWFPPDSGYTVVITKVDKGTGETDEKKNFLWWAITVQIMEDPTVSNLAGKTFRLAYLRSDRARNLKTLVRQLQNDPNAPEISLRDASQVIEGSIGMVLNVQVETTKSKKYNKEFTNVKIKDVLETEAVEAPDGEQPS